MILKELHLTDALGRISIFPPLTHNGEVRILTWPQVIDISKIRDIQIVGTSGLIKFWKLEKILLRTVAVARVYTFLEVRSRDSTWWPDLMWPRHKNFTTDVKLINEKVCQVWLRCSLSFSSYPRKTTGGGGGGKMTPPPPTRAKVNQNRVAKVWCESTIRWTRSEKPRLWHPPALASVNWRSLYCLMTITYIISCYFRLVCGLASRANSLTVWNVVLMIRRCAMHIDNYCSETYLSASRFATVIRRLKYFSFFRCITNDFF